MKSTILGLYLSVLLSSLLSAQDYSRIDAQARNTPIPKNIDIPSLAASLSAGCSSEKEKARSFFVWISKNIRYDLELKRDRDEVSGEKWKALQEPKQVIKRKKAVCEGYTNLFNALCQSTGIQTLEVSGVTKNQQGKISRNGHAWSLILADGQWGLIDATWGSGAVDAEDGKYREGLDERFFFAKPEDLIQNHYPDDPLFQCLPAPLSFEEFKYTETAIAETIAKKKKQKPMAGYSEISDSLLGIVSVDSSNLWYSPGKRAVTINPNSNFGHWALAKHHFIKATAPRDRYYKAIQDLKSVNYYPSVSWFDAQMPDLKRWDSECAISLDLLAKCSGNDNYHDRIQSLKMRIQNSKRICQNEISSNTKLQAKVKRGVRVKIIPEGN